jgi:hypothetical protein
MNFKLPAETARSIDQQAVAFIDALAPETENPKDLNGTFRPNYLRPVVSIASLELPTAQLIQHLARTIMKLRGSSRSSIQQLAYLKPVMTHS